MQFFNRRNPAATELHVEEVRKRIQALRLAGETPGLIDLFSLAGEGESIRRWPEPAKSAEPRELVRVLPQQVPATEGYIHWE